MHLTHLTGFLLPALVYAQTFTSCNPTQKTCGSDVGLNQANYNVDFTKGANSNWKMTYGAAQYDKNNGVSFTINRITDAPTMQSEFYFFFGTVTAIAKAAPGTGIVSCVILESDDLDEIDWEWLGGQPNQVQTNYFGKGNTTSYDRGSTETVQDAQNTWHNYTIQWTSAFTTWYIDGAPVRTLQYADAVGGANYPQTPMRVKLGIWSASTGGSKGTIEWAGGETNFAQAPFTMHVKSISITNSNPASTYVYGDKTGSFQSIKVQKKLANLPENVGDDNSSAQSDVQSATELPSATLSVRPHSFTSTSTAAVSSSIASSVATTVGTETVTSTQTVSSADVTTATHTPSAAGTVGISSTIKLVLMGLLAVVVPIF